VLFATHYLEEADAYADRIVLIRKGEIVADGTSAQVKSLASGRTVRATLPGAPERAPRAVPGADSIEVRGETVLIHSGDADKVARYLLTETSAHDLATPPRGLGEAFLAPPGDDDTTGGNR
jgi:ABC-type multidrug transport system, ATPase component